MTTWAPTGETPVLRCKLTRDQLSVISAISPEGQLYLAMQETAFDSDGVVTFLKLLLKEIAGKWLIIWDGAPIHRSQTIQQVLSRRRGGSHLAGAPAGLGTRPESR